MDVMKAKEELKKTVRERLGYGQEYTDEEVAEIIDDCIMDSSKLRLLPVGEKRRIGKEVFDSLRRLDILQSFIEDRSVTEVMINGYRNVFVERAGALTRLDRGFDSEEKLMDVIQQIVAGCNRTVIFIEDLNSTNGTFKNGVRLKPYEQKKLSRGDEIRLATKKLIFT